jgi:hypothetical protein
MNKQKTEFILLIIFSLSVIGAVSPPAYAQCVPAVEGPFGNATCNDSVDNDCDGKKDSADPDCYNNVGGPDVDDDGDGKTETQGDCNDGDSAVYPGATRICDGKDNNCDGRLDFPGDVDNDNDGYPKCGECNDNDSGINPGATEGPAGDPSCSDGIDNNCDGWFDAGEPNCQSPCMDNDNDGYYSTASLPACTFPLDDCNDNNAGINPGALDSNCNNVDEDCTGGPDDKYVSTPTSCGVGSCADTGVLNCLGGGVLDDTCTEGLPGTESGLPTNPSCNDGIDNDCDGEVDECACTPTGLPDNNCDAIDDDCDGIPDDAYTATPTSCGVGICASAGLLECQGGAVVDTCVAGTPGVEGPVNDPTCSGGDDEDCDGKIDMADENCLEACIDNDGDGYGNPGDPTCTNGSASDCDDTDNQVYPGALRICDGKDNNCDSRIDFSSDIDADNDGYPVCAGDCDDSKSSIHPGMLEGPPDDPTCFDGLDNDCDGFNDVSDRFGIPNCLSWEGNCYLRTEPKNGPHIFDLMDPGLDPADPADDIFIKSSCQWCHTDETGTIDQQLDCQRCHADWNDTNDPLNGVLKDPSNPSAYPLNPPYGFGTALNVKTHLHDTADSQQIPHCVTCHNPHLQEQDARYGTNFGKYIKEYICYDNPTTGLSVQELIEFTAPSGPGSYADGLPHNENICEMCHEHTSHHRRTGDAPNDLDSLGNYIGHNDSAWCIECHLHSDGFQPVARPPHNTAFFNANCQFCHLEIQGVIDFALKIPDSNCRSCHGERTSHTSNPSLNVQASGNYTYDVMCVDCHDPMTSVGNNRKLLRQAMSMSVVPGSVISNTTKTGTGSLADGPPRNKNICETCHFFTAHNRGDGTGDGIHADGNNYDGSYCMVCHDHDKFFMAPGKTCVEENEPGINCSP